MSQSQIKKQWFESHFASFENFGIVPKSQTGAASLSWGCISFAVVRGYGHWFGNDLPRVLTQFEQAGLLVRRNFESGKALYELNEGEPHESFAVFELWQGGGIQRYPNLSASG